MLIPLGILSAFARGGAITNWQKITVTDQVWRGAAFAPLTNASYYAFGASVSGGNTTNYIYSTNGTTWSNGTLPASLQWARAAFNGTTLIVVPGAVGQATTAYAYTTNGTTWTAGTLPSSTQSFDCFWDGANFVVTNRNSSVSTYHYSANGISGWTSVDAGPSLASMAYDGSSRYIAIDDGSTATARTSTTGISPGTWSNLTLPSATNWSKVVYGGGFWVIIGINGNFITSTNGTTWTAFSPPNFDNGTTTTINTTSKNIHFVDGFWYYTRSSGAYEVYYRATPNSNSGWTAVTLTTATDLQRFIDIASGNGRMIAVGWNSDAGGSNELYTGV